MKDRRRERLTFTKGTVVEWRGLERFGSRRRTVVEERRVEGFNFGKGTVVEEHNDLDSDGGQLLEVEGRRALVPKVGQSWKRE